MAVCSLTAEAAGGQQGTEMWGLESSRSDGVQNTVLSPLQRGPEEASEKGLEDVLAWSGSIQENSAPWTAHPCQSDEQIIPFQPAGSASIILLIPWTTKPLPLQSSLQTCYSLSTQRDLSCYVSHHMKLQLFDCFRLTETTVSRSVHFWSGFVFFKSLFFHFMCFGHKAWGILAPQPGIKPAPSALEDKVLTTGLPERPLVRVLTLDEIQAF